MSLRDEIFRNFTADGTAPRPERCRLGFKEENYSERKWQKTMEVSLFSYYRTWSFASEILSTKTAHFTIMDVLSQIQSLCTASPSCLWSRNTLARCGILSLLETGDRIQCSVIEVKNTFSRQDTGIIIPIQCWKVILNDNEARVRPVIYQPPSLQSKKKKKYTGRWHCSSFAMWLHTEI